MRIRYKVPATSYDVSAVMSAHQVGIWAGLYPDMSSFKVMNIGELPTELSNNLMDDWTSIYTVGVLQLRGLGVWSGSDFPYAGEPVLSVVALPNEPFQPWPSSIYTVSGHINIVVPIDTALPSQHLYWWASLRAFDATAFAIEFLGPFSEEPISALTPTVTPLGDIGGGGTISIDNTVWGVPLFLFEKNGAQYRVHNQYRGEVPVPGEWYEALRRAQELGNNDMGIGI